MIFLPISLNPNLWIRFLCKPGSWWWNLGVWGCGNLKPQLRLPSASEVCSPSPYYITSLKSINDLLVCLFLSLSFSFISSSCISPRLVLSCICLFMKFVKGDILNINEGVYSHSSYDNGQHLGSAGCDPKSHWNSRSISFKGLSIRPELWMWSAFPQKMLIG